MPVYAWPKIETLAISLRCNSSSQTMQLSKSYPARKRGNPIVRRDSQGLVGVPGVEPGTSSLSGTRSNQLSYTPAPGLRRPTRWWRQPGSNRRHPACKAGALPTELCPRDGTSLSTRAQALFLDRSRGPEGMRKTSTRAGRIDVRDVSVSATPKGVSPSPRRCRRAAP